jgi:hypothetical protein
MGGSWEGRGSPEQAPDDDGFRRMKMTGGDADGWSQTVEIEPRRFTELGRNSMVCW